jgi:hypothetical protein
MVWTCADLRGKTALDVGAWNGGFSIEAFDPTRHFQYLLRSEGVNLVHMPFVQKV